MLNGLQISDLSTSLSVTGGSAKAFTVTSVTVPNGINVADFTQTDFRLRRHITFRNRNPVKQADGSFSKAKRSFVFTTPIDAGSGKIVYLVDRWESEQPVEASATDLANHRRNVAQLLFDADVEQFHTGGSIS